MDLEEGESSLSDLDADVISGNGFKNWTKSVLAHNEAKKALCEIIEKKWKTFISKMTEEERHHIENFVQCMNESGIKHFGTDRYLSCNHQLCKVLYKNLRDLYRSTEEISDISEKTKCLPASDSCFQYYWNIAMLFGEIDDDLSKSDVIELDISNMLRMMSNCQLFSFNDSSNIYDRVHKDRNELFNTTENNISDERMYAILDNIDELLTKFEDQRFYVCIDVIRTIKQLKRQDFKDEIEMGVYRLLVEDYLKTKIKALKNDISVAGTTGLEEALTETYILLDKVKESVEDEPDEISKLQDENDKLNERIKELKHERDGLLSIMEDNEEIIDDIRRIANAAESGKEFLLLLKLLPSSELRKDIHEEELQSHAKPDLSLVTTNVKELKSYLDEVYPGQNGSLYRYHYRCHHHHHHYCCNLHSDDDEDIHEKHPSQCFTCDWRRFEWLQTLHDCCNFLRSARFKAEPLTDWIIPLLREACRQKREETVVILNRKVEKLTIDFCKDIRHLRENCPNRQSALNDIIHSGYLYSQKRNIWENSNACLEKILTGIEDTSRFVNGISLCTEEMEILFPVHHLDNSSNEVDKVIESLTNRVETFIRICSIFDKSAEDFWWFY